MPEAASPFDTEIEEQSLRASKRRLEILDRGRAVEKQRRFYGIGLMVMLSSR